MSAFRWAGRPYAVVGIALLLGSTPVCARSQAVQALRGIGEVYIRGRIDSVADALAQRITEYQEREAEGMPQGTLAATATVIAAAQHALLSRQDPDVFRSRLGDYLSAQAQLLATASSEIASLEAGRARGEALSTLETTQLSTLQSVRRLATTTPIPAIATLVPNVAFTIGFESTIGAGRPDLGVGLNTNLIGAAAGAVFDALGSSSLKDYFTNNVAIGAALPVGGRSKVASALGLGLGGVTIKNWAFWPVLAIEALDSADARVPSTLIQRNPAQPTWSQLEIAVGVPLQPIGTSIHRIECGELAPVLSIGLLLPYYFPGDSYSALAAVFSNRRSDYEHAGGVTLLAGINVPLLKVGAKPTDAQGTAVDCSSK